MNDKLERLYEEAKHVVEIVNGVKDGKIIQFHCTGEAGTWTDCEAPLFVHPLDRYRVKPEPETFYIRVYADGSLGRACYAYHGKETLLELDPGAEFKKCIEVLDE